MAHDLGRLFDEAFDPGGVLAPTYAVVVWHRGELVLERYDGVLPSFVAEPTIVTAATPLLSWSMAKSMLHAVIGMLVAERGVALDRPAPVPAWQAAGDPRSMITVEDLLAMRDGLDFVEDYVDDRSDVLEMLFGAGRDDAAAFAAARPAREPRDTRFNYSSGTTNVLSGVVASIVGPGAPYEQFLNDRLFGPLGMSTANPGFDAAGTWVASSYVHATALDVVRFGLLYLHDGVWEGERLLPERWVAHGTRPRSVDPESGSSYGAHWWIPNDAHGTFEARGYEGQSLSITPSLDLVICRFGRTPAEQNPELRVWRSEMVEAFAALSL